MSDLETYAALARANGLDLDAETLARLKPGIDPLRAFTEHNRAANQAALDAGGGPYARPKP